MKINREDVVQAALTVERWCKENCNDSSEPCDCPFAQLAACYMDFDAIPKYWGLEKFLRTRGRKYEEHWKLEERLRTRGLKHD